MSTSARHDDQHSEPTTERVADHWDPFEGRVPARRDAYTPLVKPWSPHAKRVLWLALLALPLLGFGGYLKSQGHDGWGTLIGFAAVAFGFGMAFYLTGITPTVPDGGNDPLPDKLRLACTLLGERLGWSVRLVEPDRSARIDVTAGRSAPSVADVARAIPHYPARPDKPLSARQHADLAAMAQKRDVDDGPDSRSVTLHDPDIHAAYAEIHHLLQPGIVAARPTLIHVILHRQVEGRPVWTGLALQGPDQRNPRRQRKRSIGQTADRGGYTLVAVHGIALRDVGKAAQLSATLRTRRQDVLAPDADFTVGGRFDAAFTLNVLQGDAAMLRDIVPAALRTELLSLHESDDAEAMVHNGTLFVRTITSLPQSVKSIDDLERELPGKLNRIAKKLL